MGDEKLYTDVHNYTKFKLVEMLINRMNDGRLNLDNLNAIEDVADDVLKVCVSNGTPFLASKETTFNKVAESTPFALEYS